MPRNPGEPTNEYLARRLEAVGLNEMAERARLYHFDDYKCPEDVPDAGLNINRLVFELTAQVVMQLSQTRKDQIIQLINEAVHGEFDGTKEEADEWFNSEGGQEFIAAVNAAKEIFAHHNIFKDPHSN